MTKQVLAIAGCILLAGAEGLRAQSASLPLSAFSAGFAEQSGSGRRVLAQVGNLAVGRSSGSGKAVSSGFLPGAVRLAGGTVDVPEPGPLVPWEFGLSQNYPNPFNPSTRIRFQIVEQGDVTLKVYDLLGREVRTLVDENLSPGSHETVFDATELASGVYFYRLKAGKLTATKRQLLLK
jgi:hypothetical protein